MFDLKNLDIINNVTKTEDNQLEVYRLYRALLEQMNVYENILVDHSEKIFNDNIKGYFVSKHLCTDTIVGNGVITLKNVPVALFIWSARKSPILVYFFNQECESMVYSFLLSLIDNEYNVDDIWNCDIYGQPFDTTYRVVYNFGFLSTHKILYGNQTFTFERIVEHCNADNIIEDYGVYIEIKDAHTGEKLIVRAIDVEVISEIGND